MNNEDSPFDEKNTKEVTMDDMMSDEEQVLTELLYASEPVTIKSVADKTNVSTDKIGGIATTLINSGYLLTDSRSPGFDEEASLFPDPIVSDLIRQVETFRVADSKRDITESISEYEKVISELKQDTGFKSAKDFNQAVFDENETVQLSDENRDKSMRWTVLEEQLETLKEVEDKYEEFEERNEILEESFRFTPTPINPPSHERQKHLEPVVSFPF